jgi:hypothetical protein
MNDFGESLIKGAIEGLGELAKEIVKGGAALGRKQVAKLSVDFEFGFKDFLGRNYRRLSRVKTLLNPNLPASLEATYVAPNFRFGSRNLSERQFISLVSKEKFVVVTGIGGSGKSIFLKHLFVRYCNEALGRVPMFVELRQLNAEVSLIDYMAQQISAVAPAIDFELFRYALKVGKFILLLDGFDEVEPAFRDGLAKQIVDLSYEFGENSIVLTSRPDGPFGSWGEFFVTQLAPFKKRQVLSLISKMEYDSDAKREFSHLVESKLFDSHSAYLSNPLLCTLMLLTFDQGGEIPSKMHVFFERTFDVLFYKHDASKEVSFRRKFQTNLPIDDFRKAFAAFSMFCYLDHGSSFTHLQALGCAKRALEYNEFVEAAAAFVSDLCTSVSVLIREGDDYNYIHRSLQEFFVAEFLASREIEDWELLVQHILEERSNDSVVRLLADINRDRFEKQFLARRIARMRTDVERIDVLKNPAAMFKLFYISFSYCGDEVASWTVGKPNFKPKWHYLERFLDRHEELMEASGALDSFDWGAHFTKVGATIELEISGHDEEAELVDEIAELIEVTDVALLGTPMIAFLAALKSAIVATDERLRATAATQKRLVSTALFKR